MSFIIISILIINGWLFYKAGKAIIRYRTNKNLAEARLSCFYFNQLMEGV